MAPSITRPNVAVTPTGRPARRSTLRSQAPVSESLEPANPATSRQVSRACAEEVADHNAVNVHLECHPRAAVQPQDEGDADDDEVSGDRRGREMEPAKPAGHRCE